PRDTSSSCNRVSRSCSRSTPRSSHFVTHRPGRRWQHGGSTLGRTTMKADVRLLLASFLALVPLAARADDDDRARARHVLLLSIDGFHGVDLENWVHDHPGSALARLSRRGTTFDNARASTPSDSFPGLISIVTGGSPRVTGVYYDDSYDRTLFAPGSNCQGEHGTEVIYDETRD